MAKLYFYYSAMNAGKSTTLLQSAYNYEERGMETILYSPILDDRYTPGIIKSRIGIQRKCLTFDATYHFFTSIKSEIGKNGKVKCILVDEAQFLTEKQVFELSDIVDKMHIPVLTYGLRTDFKAKLFPGSKYLLALADEIIEIKTICKCGKKALMNMRVDKNGIAVTEGNQIEIGGNERYVSMCRKCFKHEIALATPNLVK